MVTAGGRVISQKQIKNIKLPKTNLCEPSAPLREVFMTSACITLMYCLMTVFIISRKGAEGSQSIFGFLREDWLRHDGYGWRASNISKTDQKHKTPKNKPLRALRAFA